MALNFTGRVRNDEPLQIEDHRGPSRLILGCLVLAVAAFLLALIVFGASRLGPHPQLAPPQTLVGVAPPEPKAVQVQAAPPPAISAPVAAARQTSPAAPAKPQASEMQNRRALFVAALRRAPGQITLQVEDDAEAQAYGRELQSLFVEAGWMVTVSQSYGAGPPARGLASALGSTPQDAAVAEAFAAAGIHLPGGAPSGVIVHTPEIFIGAPLLPTPAPSRRPG